jgi:hypothetical protein
VSAWHTLTTIPKRSTARETKINPRVNFTSVRDFRRKTESSYRAGRKDIGGYARFTATDEQLARAELEQALRNAKRELGEE